MTITLNVEKREETGKNLKKLREDGEIPAVIYGRKVESTPIKLNEKEFSKAFKEAGESSVIILSGAGDDSEVLVHSVDVDPIKSEVLHVDFYAVEKGKKVTVNIPIEFVGEAPAVKLGGSLTKALHEVEMTAEPSKLPHEIEVDVSSLETFEDHIRVKDLSIPKDVEIGNDLEETVAVVTENKEEPEEIEEVDMDAVEVEEKGKDESSEENEDEKSE